MARLGGMWGQVAQSKLISLYRNQVIKCSKLQRMKGEVRKNGTEWTELHKTAMSERRCGIVILFSYPNKNLFMLGLFSCITKSFIALQD